MRQLGSSTGPGLSHLRPRSFSTGPLYQGRSFVASLRDRASSTVDTDDPALTGGKAEGDEGAVGRRSARFDLVGKRLEDRMRAGRDVGPNPLGLWARQQRTEVFQVQTRPRSTHRGRAP